MTVFFLFLSIISIVGLVRGRGDTLTFEAELPEIAAQPLSPELLASFGQLCQWLDAHQDGRR